ncbi:MAG TPA: hypothetical protein PKE00_05635 [Planctomycetota bacterium]|nr:hypothetical protein [Planctomycetota bacterium]
MKTFLRNLPSTLTASLTLAAACGLSSAALSAQKYYNFSQTVSRSGSHVASVGNSNLGGSLVTSAGISHSTSAVSSSANANFSMSATGRLLGMSKEIAYLGANASSSRTSTMQSRSAVTTLRILGYNWGTSSTSGHSFSKREYDLKLFPIEPRMSVPLGPISLTIKGNCGVNVTCVGGLYLPTGVPEVSLTANASTGAFAKASVGASVPGFGVAVEVRGDVGVQQLGVTGRANPILQVLRGDAYYTLTAISIKLVAKAWALWWDTSKTLASWSSSPFQKTLFSVYY